MGRTGGRASLDAGPLTSGGPPTMQPSRDCGSPDGLAPPLRAPAPLTPRKARR